MQIAIQLSPDNVLLLTSYLQAVYSAKSSAREHRAFLSIIMDVALKFEGKATKTKSKAALLFEDKKKVKVNLKYHEADTLEMWLLEVIGREARPYQVHQLQTIISQLNQKLV